MPHKNYHTRSPTQSKKATGTDLLQVDNTTTTFDNQFATSLLTKLQLTCRQQALAIPGCGRMACDSVVEESSRQTCRKLILKNCFPQAFCNLFQF